MYVFINVAGSTRRNNEMVTQGIATDIGKFKQGDRMTLAMPGLYFTANRGDRDQVMYAATYTVRYIISKSFSILSTGNISLIARFMGPTWDPSGADRTQMGPMLIPWTLLSGIVTNDGGRNWYSQTYVAYAETNLTLINVKCNVTYL